MTDYTLLPACPTEDSTDCYWDATVQGNGTGSSFASVDGVQIPLTVPEGTYILDVAAYPDGTALAAYQEYATVQTVPEAGYDPLPIAALAVAGIIASFIIFATAYVKRAR